MRWSSAAPGLASQPEVKLRDRCQLARDGAQGPGLGACSRPLRADGLPRFEQEEVLQAASAGWLLPAGLTRFVISPRALRVNYPLERLSSDRPLEAKRAELAAWIRDRAEGRRVRYYAESTFLFDE
jgi:hypothetical protein